MRYLQVDGGEPREELAVPAHTAPRSVQRFQGGRHHAKHAGRRRLPL